MRDGTVLELCLATGILLLGLHWQAAAGNPWKLRGFGWVRSCGRLSYEIYLFHMFCVFGVLALAKASGLNPDWSFVWYAPVIALACLLGLAIARGFSEPCERWLRQRFL
jgi:peptidoglycan/LPS O-acetylase OafA/YrhL